MKTVSTVLIEALFVGIILSIMLTLFTILLPNRSLIWLAVAAFVCGAAFHIICQVTGINDWYVKNYYK
jgi:hypothetical protein